jgi:hypothetical protein
MPRKETKAAREAVARVAYELYLRRGGEHGHDVEDWLTAELLLKEKLKRRRNSSVRPRASRRAEDKSRL